jgi:hypothetical protein
LSGRGRQVIQSQDTGRNSQRSNTHPNPDQDVARGMRLRGDLGACRRCDDLACHTILARSHSNQMYRLEAFLSVCEWVQVYYLWRPNLRDDGDNHILELAVAGGASVIVTKNVADFRGSELRFADIRILSPKILLKELA